ncbi:MAG: U3 snoRNP protein [Chaenotheca gracillima]|nr:MAG: U3 snoRNP protein [Chaenotheca gracillima]
MISIASCPRAAAKSQLQACMRPSGSYILGLKASPAFTVKTWHGIGGSQRWESTSAVRVNHNVKVNPPVSTLPAPLVLQDREPNEKFISYAFKQGKGYLNFYKSGLKSVYYNFRDTQSILNRLDLRGNAASIASAAQDKILTRSDYHFIRRSARDVAKLPLFALVFLVFGEFTPFVVVFMSGVVPYPCRIPKQVLNERRGLEERRAMSFRGLTEGPPPAQALANEGLDAMNLNQVLHVARSLGLYSKIWPEGLLASPPLLDWVVKRRIRQRLEYLELDDSLIARDGGVVPMEAEEVTMALVERGVDTLGTGDAQQKDSLKHWLRATTRARSPILQLLLTRQSVWPAKDTN